MLQSKTVSKLFICVLVMIMVLLMTSTSRVESKAVINANNLQTQNSENVENSDDNKSRQFLFIKGVGRETSTPDFIRLVVMRFIYGLASTMGVEDRLEGLFNGAFVPPNADGDIFGLSAFGDDGSDDVGGFDEAALEGLFSDDAF
ncbi:uncharacterized protein ACRADG_005062 [Cochliomyia hominivorax]